MSKVLIITYYWPPSGGAGVQRWLKFSKYFLELGIQPIVLTVDEKSASYPVLDASLAKEIPAGVQVVRTRTNEPFGMYKKISGKDQLPSGGFASGTTSSLKDTFMRFIRGNFFIPDARIGWNKFAFEAAAEIIRKEKPVAVITSSPPHSTQLIGLKLQRAFGLPWIADLRDPWTDIYYYKKMLHLPPAKAKDQKLERQVLEQADKVVVVSDDIKRMFMAKGKGIAPEKIAVIPNGYDEKDFENRTGAGESRFVIAYTGTIAESYSPDSFFNALGALIKNNPGTAVLFRFVGSMPKEMHARLTSSLGNHFEYVPYSPHDKAIGYLLSSSALYLAIPQAKDNKGILTGKLFEYLAAQKPIVATGPVDGDAAAIIHSCGAGKMFGVNDENAIGSHLQNLLDEWKTNKNPSPGSQEFMKYSRKNLTARFAGLVKEVTR